MTIHPIKKFITEPMLAPHESVDLTSSEVPYPILGSTKLDGIRCLRIGGGIVSRKFKQIPNYFINEQLAKLRLPEGMDGELITYEQVEGELVIDPYNNVQSKVMSYEGTPIFKYNVFDLVTREHGTAEPFILRYARMLDFFSRYDMHGIVVPVYQTELKSALEASQYEQAILEQGFEGVMLRDGVAPYSCGRSMASHKRYWLAKLVQWTTDEAIITGFEEQLANTNIRSYDTFGKTERSSHASELEPKGTVGVIIAQHTTLGTIKLGTGLGLTNKLRDKMWLNQSDYISRVVKFKYKKERSKDKPSQPIFIGFRDITID